MNLIVGGSLKVFGYPRRKKDCYRIGKVKGTLFLFLL